MSGLSRSCCRWHEWKDRVRSKRSLDFVRLRLTRDYPLESELPYAIMYFLKHDSYRTECFFEKLDLYRTLDLKSNPMDSCHFENNFKRTINCPAIRSSAPYSCQQLGLIWMSLVSRGLTGVIVFLWRTLLNNGEVIMRTCHLLLPN